MQGSTISKLKKAKTAHIRWRTYAEALVSGHDKVIDQLPVKHTDCEFGNWYYNEGQQFTDLEVFKDIGQIHQELHDEFEMIFNLITLGNEKIEEKGFFAKLLGKTVSNNDKNRLKAQDHLSNLNAISKVLVQKLEELEQYLVDQLRK